MVWRARVSHQSARCDRMPPMGREVAHQIINNRDYDLKYFCLSTNEPVDICEYPDSSEVLSMSGEPSNRTFRHISKIDDAVDYFTDEI